MNQLTRAIACLGFIGAFGGVLAQDYPYVVDRYDVGLDLRRDGTMEVTERLDVTFNERRRGIFRFIPVVYDTGKGLSRSIFLSRVSVTDGAGRGQPTKIEREGANLSIRVGDPDVWLDPGTSRTYVFRYRVENVVNWFDESWDWQPYAELYWNVTGDRWDTELREVSCRVWFPRVEGARGVRARVFVGPYGSRNQDSLFEPASDVFGTNTGVTMTLTESELICVRREALPPFNGITLVLNLPSDAIAKPTVGQSLAWVLLPNLGFTIPVWVLLAMAVLWFRYGRDPAEGPIAVQFDPPDGITGAEIGTLLDERVDQRDLVAGIVSLAVKGYVVIHPKQEGLIFKHRTAHLSFTDKKPQGDLTNFEASLYEKLKKCGETVDESDLRSRVAPEVGPLRNALYAQLVSRGYYLRNPEAVRTLWLIGGLVGVVALAFLFNAISVLANPLPSWVGGVVGGLIVAWFSRGMPKRTTLGSKARSLARGFEEFMRRARSQELDWMTKRHPDQALFEAYLPHAVALGLIREWAQAFEGIVQRLPSWYDAPPGTAFHPSHFASDLGSITRTVGSAATTPPRSSGASGGSSGFGGGGFSGGGFGGGGGGSW